MFHKIVLRDLSVPVRARHSKYTGPYYWCPAAPGSGRGFYLDSQGECGANGAGFRLRIESANDHLNGRLAFIDGYYCDPDCASDSLRPIIARLPHGRGFLAGWTMGPGMCATIGAYIYPDEVSAAHGAHSMAESDSEEERMQCEAENDNA